MPKTLIVDTMKNLLMTLILKKQRPTVLPITFRLTAGPGSIAAAITVGASLRSGVASSSSSFL
ncbi:hypothetical protein OURE66S_01376 [Oligella ureolytica]